MKNLKKMFLYRFLVYKNPERAGGTENLAPLKTQKGELSKKIKDRIKKGELLSDPANIAKYTGVTLKEFKRFKERNPKIAKIIQAVMDIVKKSLPGLLKYLGGIKIRKGLNLSKIRRKLAEVSSRYGKIIDKIRKKGKELTAEVAKEKKLKERREQLGTQVDEALLPYATKFRPQNYDVNDFISALKLHPKYKEAIKDINKGSLEDLKDFKVSHYFKFEDSKPYLDGITVLAEQLAENIKNPPKVSDVVYRNGQINVSGSNLKLLNLSELQLNQKFSFNFSLMMKKNSSKETGPQDMFSLFASVIDSNLRLSLVRHLQRNAALTPKQINNIKLMFYRLRTQEPNPFLHMAKKLALKSGLLTFTGKSSGDGDFKHNKELALKRAHDAREKFCTKYGISGAMKKRMKLEAYVLGPEGVIASQAEANRMYGQLAKRWNKHLAKLKEKNPNVTDKPLTAKEMRTKFAQNDKGQLSSEHLGKFLEGHLNKMRGVDVSLMPLASQSVIKVNMIEKAEQPQRVA